MKSHIGRYRRQIIARCVAGTLLALCDGGTAWTQERQTGEAVFTHGIRLGTDVSPEGTVIIQSTNGSNIALNPQGKGKVLIGGGAGTLSLRALEGGNVILPQVQPGPLIPLFSFNAALSGTVSGDAISPWARLAVSSDTAGVRQAISDLEVDHNFGGNGWAGARIGILSNMVQLNPVQNDGVIEGMQSSVSLTRSFGGTNLNMGARGAATAFNPFLSLSGGFRNGRGGSGVEVDIAAAQGTTFQTMTGVAVVHMPNHASQGVVDDVGYQLADQPGASRGWLEGLEFGGRGGQWPIDANRGTLVKAELGFNSNMDKSTAAFGDDYLLADFSDAAFRTRGLSILGDGTLRIGGTFLSANPSGLSISTSGSIGRVASVASGGSGWPADGNAYYATDNYDGVYLLRITDRRVTAVTIYRTPVVEGLPPQNRISLTPDHLAAARGAKGLLVNLTWWEPRELLLNPVGNTIVGPGSPLPKDAALGFLFVPTMDGFPRATPGSVGRAAMVVDTRDSKLCFNWASGQWKCTELH